MNRHKKFSLSFPVFIYFSIFILLVLSLYFFFKEKAIAVEVSKIQRGDFSASLMADGLIKAKKKWTIQARATGDLKRFDFKVGEDVKKGQKLTELIWDHHENVKAPISGIITKIYRESAGPIQRGDPIVDIVDPQDMEVEAEILTLQASQVKKDSPVRIKLSETQNQLSGKVRKVSRAGYVKLSALGIEEEKTIVYIDLLNPMNTLLGDTFHVDVEILVQQKKDVLKIPLAALFKNKNQWSVYLIKNNRAFLQEIVIADRNETEALFIQPANLENEKVILFPSDQIHQGTLVEQILSDQP